MDTAQKLNHSTPLIDLLQDLVQLPDPVPQGLLGPVSGIQLDSRLIQPGDLFIACFGRHHDARTFIPRAVADGASAVLAESGAGWQGVSSHEGVVVVAVDNLWCKISEIAARFYRRPSEKMSVIGITGTNGKTSSSHFLAHALSAYDINCGLIGTLGYGPCGALKESALTTPDAVFTQRVLAELEAEGVDSVAMEVSSVGLHQKRVAAVSFDTAVFTNITRDHLDYHGSMEAYAASKKKLFSMPGLRHAVVNLDDPYALSIINDLAADVEISTYSVKNSIATVHAKTLDMNSGGFSATIQTPMGEGRIDSKLLGSFNVSNILAVVTILLEFLSRSNEADIATLCEKVSALRPINGRMEIVGGNDEVTAVVDYAHTPDGLRSALTALREHFCGRIWCVFGCGGNRDKGKRPIMGEVAEALADHLVVTDDNPRHEEGDEIVSHILSGISDRSGVSVIRDRAQAIDFAIGKALPGDVILVAGKGHETYQDVAGVNMIFSDENHVRLALQRRAGGES